MENNSYIPYGRQQIEEDDIAAVVDVLRSDWLTTGPMVDKFEQAVADYTGAKYAVAVSSGTAALHAAMFAIGIGPGDEVIVPPMTFVATANAVVYQGGTPVFVDIEAETLLINPDLIEEKITPRTKAIIAVDYAGQPCDYDALRKISDRHGLYLVADACHSLGAEYKGRKVGSLADLTVFSFHPVKPITTGEGGMVVTDNAEWTERIRRFRNHGIDNDHHQRAQKVSFYYDMTVLGNNYRLSDIHAALGCSQIAKLPCLIVQRRELAARYNDLLDTQEECAALLRKTNNSHGYHLYVIRIDSRRRDSIFMQLRNAGIGVNIHYEPVYLHSFYRETFSTRHGMCPRAESAAGEILSLPIYPQMVLKDVDRVVNSLLGCIKMCG